MRPLLFVLCMGVPFVSRLSFAQNSPEHVRSPQILYISREFWKPGHEIALNRIEAEAARECIGLGVPHPYLGIESLTGPKEVWYINGFASAEMA